MMGAFAGAWFGAPRPNNRDTSVFRDESIYDIKRKRQGKMESDAEGLRAWWRSAAPNPGRGGVPQTLAQEVATPATLRNDREARWQAFCSNTELRAELNYAIHVGVDC